MNHISKLITDTLETELAQGAPPSPERFPATHAYLTAKDWDATDSLAVLLSHIALIDRHGMDKFLAHERAIQR